MGRLECLQHTVPTPPAAPRSLIRDPSSEQKLPWREIWNFWASWRIRDDGWLWREHEDRGRGCSSGGVEPAVATLGAHESWLTDRTTGPRFHGNHWQPTVWDWDRAAASLSLLALLVCLLLASLSVFLADLLKTKQKVKIYKISPLCVSAEWCLEESTPDNLFFNKMWLFIYCFCHHLKLKIFEIQTFTKKTCS